MKLNTTARAMAVLALAFGGATLASTAYAVDVEAAKEVARQNNCFKCHSVSKAKDGPAWHDVAAKMKQDFKTPAEAEARLMKHLTTGEKAKFPDGHEEEHKIVKTKDQAELKNLVDWILSL